MSECTNPDIGQLIGRYEFDLLTPEEKALFEAHALECDVCFKDLHSFSPAAKTIKRHKKLFQKIVQEETAGFKLYRLFVPYKILRWTIAMGALLLIVALGIQIKDLLHNPASSDEVMLSQEKPQLLTPHDPDFQTLKGDIEISGSEIEKTLIQSMNYQVDINGKQLFLSWENITNVQSYTLILIDQFNQDTIFTLTGIVDTSIHIPLGEIVFDHQYVWQLSGFAGEQQIIQVSKGISFK